MTAWTEVPLRELLTKSEEWVKLEPLDTITQVRVQWWGQGAVARRTATVGELGSDKWLAVRHDQFLISRIDARKGAAGTVPASLDGAFVSNDFPAFNIDARRLVPQFLDWYSKTPRFIRDCEAASEGTTNRVRLKEDRFYAIKVPLPPIEEQRRIVERIEALSSDLHRINSLHSDVEKEVRALLSAIDICPMATTLSGKTARLEDLCERITKGESPEWQGFSYQDSGALFIRSENVLWGRLDLSKRVRVPLEFHQKLSRSQLKLGDVLINLVGASIGRSCAVQQDISPANVNQAVAVVRPAPELLSGAYLVQFLLSRSIQRIIHDGRVETARPNISLSDLRNLIVPLPTLEQQQELANSVQSHKARVEKLLSVQKEADSESRQLFPAILNQAFSGQL
jgi:type I restriction enzyme S subunit